MLRRRSVQLPLSVNSSFSFTRAKIVNVNEQLKLEKIHKHLEKLKTRHESKFDAAKKSLVNKMDVVEDGREEGACSETLDLNEQDELQVADSFTLLSIQKRAGTHRQRAASLATAVPSVTELKQQKPVKIQQTTLRKRTSSVESSPLLRRRPSQSKSTLKKPKIRSFSCEKSGNSSEELPPSSDDTKQVPLASILPPIVLPSVHKQKKTRLLKRDWTKRAQLDSSSTWKGLTDCRYLRKPHRNKHAVR